MAAVAAHHHAPDDDEHTDGQEEMDPARSVEHECGNGPHNEESHANEYAEVHVPCR